MLSHTIDVTQRGDESTVCGRLANYESGSRIPRHARLRRQIEEQEAAANAAEDAAEEQKSEEGNSDLTKDAEQVPVDDTENGLQGSDENSEDTSKHVLKDTDESKEAEQDHESDTTPEQHAEVVNQTAKYVNLMYVCPCIV